MKTLFDKMVVVYLLFVFRFGISFPTTAQNAILSDIDECAFGERDCDPVAICVNTYESYSCECGAGFEQLEDGRCLKNEEKDIDECALGEYDCDPDAICVNSYGSYSCECRAGFEQLEDGRCLKKEEKDTLVHLRHSMAEAIAGIEGYKLLLKALSKNQKKCTSALERITATVSPSGEMPSPSTCQNASLPGNVSLRVNATEGKTMAEIIRKFEGKEAKVYEIGGKKHIGIGFNLEQPAAREIFEALLPGVSFKDVLAGKRKLEDAEIDKLFQHTLKRKIRTAKRLFPNYDKYPRAVQIALVNGVFRGEFKRGHTTVKLINCGEWDKVPAQYINRKDYKESEKGTGLPGIKPRMDFNAEIFKAYAKELKKEK